jgi:hypothetical protein
MLCYGYACVVVLVVGVVMIAIQGPVRLAVFGLALIARSRSFHVYSQIKNARYVKQLCTMYQKPHHSLFFSLPQEVEPRLRDRASDPCR